ncbi:MAG TPA: hypothetical protein VI389_02490 [Geobacteraceae bacterium]
MKEFGRSLRELTRVEQLIILYLALPVAAFYLGWLKPVLGVGCTALLALVLLPGIGKKHPSESGRLPLPTVVAVILVATCWSSLGGAGHLFYANSDWPVRDAVLRDLVAFPWPVDYATTFYNADYSLLLRAPLGYFLFPALAAKIVGLRYADYLLLGWTIAGTSLLFLHLAASCRKNSRLFLTILVFIFFSGMDVIGTLINHDPLSPTAHLEWWGKYFQYSSMTTVLFWVPNHGLPGWLAASLIVRNWRNPRFLPAAFIVTTLVPLWSPLSAVGVLLLFAATSFHHLRNSGWRFLLVPDTFIAAIIALPIARYLTLGAATIESGWVMSAVSSPAVFFSAYTLFVSLELAVGAVALAGEIRYKTGYAWLTASALLFLLLLPFYYYGPGNDLAMRVSIPLLAVLALRTAAILGTCLEERAYVLCAFSIALLAIGAVTPACEIARSLLSPRWQPDPATNLVDVTQANAPHYYVKLPAGEIPWVLRKPSGP